MAREEFEPLDDLLIGVLRQIAFVDRLTIGETTLTLQESFLIRELAGREELSQQDLAGRLRIDKSRVSRVATALEESGWVERHRDETNRRQYKVRLTNEGKKLATTMARTVRRHHAELFKAMTAQERSALERGLTALHRGFDAGAWEAMHQRSINPKG